MDLYLAFLLVISIIGVVSSSSPVIESKIFSTLKSQGTVNVIVSFKESKSREIVSEYEKSYTLLERSFNHDGLPSLLKSHADETQNRVLNLLKGMSQGKTAGQEFTQLWITNQIFVKNADANAIQALKGMGEISSIEEDKTYNMNEFWGNLNSTTHSTSIGRAEDEIAWGVADIGAPEAWAAGYTGKGAVVGIIDTGVNMEHEALTDNYRVDYGWFDATGPGLAPYDDNGHGTHCAGTAVGKMGIGVAPDAQWIACKALSGLGSATQASIYICGQWMLCPTDTTKLNANCSMRPNVVSNSWGFGGPPNQNYVPVTEAWTAAGMVALFANGNSGQLQCNSVNSPAEYPRVMGIGATDNKNKVTSFSSRGPSRIMSIKPDVSAPGADILSADSKNTRGYTKLSGTSMATPHVAGLAALLVSANPSLGHDGVRKALIQGAQEVVPTKGLPCGGRLDTTLPNNYVGYGKVNAPKSLGI